MAQDAVLIRLLLSSVFGMAWSLNILIGFVKSGGVVSSVRYERVTCLMVVIVKDFL